jgi:hypothetical protein
MQKHVPMLVRNGCNAIAMKEACPPFKVDKERI